MARCHTLCVMQGAAGCGMPTGTAILVMWYFCTQLLHAHATVEQGHVAHEVDEVADMLTQEATNPDAESDGTAHLRAKFQQLQALMEARGEGIDPELVERAKELQGQLNDLEQRAGQLSSSGEAARTPAEVKARLLTSRSAACAAMASATSGGLKVPIVASALKALVEDRLPVREAARLGFFQQVAVCINHASDEQLAEFRVGRSPQLPEALLERAGREEEAVLEVLEVYSESWIELKEVASIMLQGGGRKSKGLFSPEYPWIILVVIPTVHLLRYLIRRYWKRRPEGQHNPELDDQNAEKKGSKATKKELKVDKASRQRNSRTTKDDSYYVD